MRNFTKFLPRSPLQHRSATHEPFSQCLSFLFSSESTAESAISHLSPVSNNPNNANTEIPTSQNLQNPPFLSQSDVTEALLRLKEEPLCALKYYRSAKKQRGVNGGVDSFCVLLHIFVGFEDQKQRVYQWVSSQESLLLPLFLILIETAKRFGFDLDPRVFNYLVKVYVHADRFEDAIACLNGTIDNNSDLRIASVNGLLNVLVRRKMIKEARELCDKMSSEGIFGDSKTTCVMIRAYMKSGSAEEAERCFRKAMDKGVELDAAAYIRALGAVSENAACELLKEMEEKGWVPSKTSFIKIIKASVNNRDMTKG